MKKLIFIATIFLSYFSQAQVIAIDEEPVKAEPVYELKEDSVTVEKVELKEVIVTTTLDEIQAQIDKYNADILSNQNQIIYFQGLITKLEAEYQYLKSIGALTNEEKNPPKEGDGKEPK